MIEIYLATGLYFIEDLYHQRGNVFGGIGAVGENSPMELQVLVNGKTLLETVPTFFNSGQVLVVENSGDFFLSGLLLKTETGFLNLNYGESFVNLKYDHAGGNNRIFYSHSTHTGMLTGFNNQFLAESLSKPYVFLNGIKLVSGVNYREIGGQFEWLDSDIGITGVLHSLPYISGFNKYSGVYDIKGNRFNEFVSYLNGLKLGESDFLKTASIVEIIKTGLTAEVEFNSQRETTTIFL